MEAQLAQMDQLIQQFHTRVKYYTIMNILLIVWCIVQISVYAWQVSLAPCHEGPHPLTQ